MREILNNAAQFAITHKNNETQPIHTLLAMLADSNMLLYQALQKNNENINALIQNLTLEIDKLPKVSNANTQNMSLSKSLREALQNALSFATTQGDSFIGVDSFVRANLDSHFKDLLKNIDKLELINTLKNMRKGMKIDSQSSDDTLETLDKYGINLSKLAAQNKLNPVIGRNEEIERMMQILIRKTKNNEPTYKPIIKHIIQSVYADFNILVRLNYTKRNADTFVNIIKHFRNISEEKKKNITFSFHKVWQEDPDPETEGTINDARNWFQKEGLRINRPMIESKGRCYADKQNHIVINYNGDLYKCTAVNFLRENREGVLSNDGNTIWNKRYTQRMSIKYKNKICKKCILFPICHGGCTQDALIYNKDGCLRNYSKEEKEEILYRRVIELLKTMKTY